jgi:hypothetical protein
MPVTSGESDRQSWQRNQPDPVRRQESLKWKEEPRDGSRRGSHQEDVGPALEDPPAQQVPQDHKTRSDANQAYRDMEQSQCNQHHDPLLCGRTAGFN